MKDFHSLFKSRAAIDVLQPITYEDRRAIADRFKNQLLEGIPVYVDKMNNRVKDLYTSRPTRIYLIGKDGRVKYNPGIGPYSFNPDYLEPVLKDYIKSSTAQ